MQSTYRFISQESNRQRCCRNLYCQRVQEETEFMHNGSNNKRMNFQLENTFSVNQELMNYLHEWNRKVGQSITPNVRHSKWRINFILLLLLPLPSSVTFIHICRLSQNVHMYELSELQRQHVSVSGILEHEHHFVSVSRLFLALETLKRRAHFIRKHIRWFLELYGMTSRRGGEREICRQDALKVIFQMDLLPHFRFSSQLHALILSPPLVIRRL